jgi:hypothetical protein
MSLFNMVRRRSERAFNVHIIETAYNFAKDWLKADDISLLSPV